MSGGNGKAARDDFWAKLTMEQIEHNIAVGTPRNRVLFTLIRFQICYPHLHEFAIRPRLKRAGFAECVRLLHERILKQRPVSADDIYEEIPDTDERGEILSLSQRDIAEITGLQRSHVSEAIELLRKEGLIEDGTRLILIRKPTVVPPALLANLGEVPCTGNFLEQLLLKTKDLAKTVEHQLGVKFPVQENWTEIELQAAVQVLTEVSTAFKEGLSKLRTECRNRLKEAGTGNASLLDRSKTSEERSSSSSFVEDTPPWDEEPTTTTEPDKAKIHEALSQHGHPDEEATEILVKRCRKQAPDCTADEIVHFIKDRASVLPDDVRNPIGWLITAVPKCFAGEAFTKFRARPAGKEKEDPLVAYIQAQRARGAGGGK